MDKNLKFILVVIMILAILYLLYKNSSESYLSCSKKNDENIENNDTTENNLEHPQKKSKNKLTLYKTRWCGYCNQFLQQMKNGLQTKIEDLDIDVSYVDCDDNKDACNNANVKGYPTLKYKSNKQKHEITYNGDRSEHHLLHFLKNN